VRHFISNAELIRAHPECPDRTAEAERLIRQTMNEFAVGALTDDERGSIFEILAFAIPPLPASLIDHDVQKSGAENSTMT